MVDVTDILTEIETGELVCRKGDFEIGDATRHHQMDLLSAKEGEFKQWPLTGVDVGNFLNDEDQTDLLRKIRIQFLKDGMTIYRLDYSNGLYLNAEYK